MIAAAPSETDTLRSRYIESSMRANGGPGFWVHCHGSFAATATELFRDAIRRSGPSSAVLSHRKMARHPNGDTPVSSISVATTT